MAMDPGRNYPGWIGAYFITFRISPPLSMAGQGMNYAFPVSTTDLPDVVDELPKPIPGLDHALVSSYMEEVGGVYCPKIDG